MDEFQGTNIVGLLSPLRRYARSLTRGDQGADDLVHDALLRAYEKRETYRAGGSLRTWLFSIVHSVFVDDWRRRESEARRDEKHVILPSMAGLGDPESRLRVKQVLDMFVTLPDEQRAALHLVAVEGLSYHEAADSLGVPIGTLMSRLARARAALRDRETGVDTPEQRRRTTLRVVGADNDE
jgi:RNA polymerase sigma factor (sigma-70 family)